MENRRRQSMLSGIFHFQKCNSCCRAFSDSLTKQLALPGFSGFRYFDYLIFRLFVFSKKSFLFYKAGKCFIMEKPDDWKNGYWYDSYQKQTGS